MVHSRIFLHFMVDHGGDTCIFHKVLHMVQKISKVGRLQKMDCIPVNSKYLEVVAIRQWESVWYHIIMITSWKTIGWKLLENYHTMYTLENYWMKIWYDILMDRSIVVKVDGPKVDGDPCHRKWCPPVILIGLEARINWCDVSFISPTVVVINQNTYQTYHTSSISCHGWLFHHLPCLGQRTGVNSNHPSRRRSFAHRSSTKQSLDIACGRCPSALPRKQRNGPVLRPVLSLPLAGWLLLWGELMFDHPKKVVESSNILRISLINDGWWLGAINLPLHIGGSS